MGDFEYEVQIPYLLYRNAAQEVNGIWFYNARECEEVANLFSRYCSSYGLNYGNAMCLTWSHFFFIAKLSDFGKILPFCIVLVWIILFYFAQNSL